MSEKISPKDITVLSATMLIPLWAKAVEYERSDALLRDKEAARILNMIDYDFAPFTKAPASQVGCCGRCGGGATGRRLGRALRAHGATRRYRVVRP